MQIRITIIFIDDRKFDNTNDWINKIENGYNLFAVTRQSNIINDKMLILSKQQIVEFMKSDDEIQAIIEHLDKANKSRYQCYQKELYEWNDRMVY